MPLDDLEFTKELEDLDDEDKFSHPSQALEVIVDEETGAITAFYKNYGDMTGGRPKEIWSATFDDVDDLADWINTDMHKWEQIMYQIKKRRIDGTLDYIGNLVYYDELDGYTRENVAKPDEFFDALEDRVKGRFG